MDTISKVDLGDHYKKMWDTSFPLFEKGHYELDPLIDAVDDTRYGLTLLARPSQKVKENILNFLDELKQLEPRQYYYPASDLHITIMSVISCSPTFSLSKVNVEEYKSLIRGITDELPAFQVQFKGITASPSCIMVQGFPIGDCLQGLRDRVRITFRNSTLLQSMDVRYSIVTAHSTVVRFRELPVNSEAFNKALEKYRNYNFGTFKVGEVELVGNDWYQRKEKVKQLEKFRLQG